MNARAPSVFLAGMDLAWVCEKNPTAIAYGCLNAKGLTLTAVDEGLVGMQAVRDALVNKSGLRGVAIDAPLIIRNASGSRECEKALARVYASRKASCHPANLCLYPDADSLRLARALQSAGFEHAGRVEKRWQIECYPHPAIIEIFGLNQRLQYKKGTVGERRSGQQDFARRLLSLSASLVLPLQIDVSCLHYFSASRIVHLRGRALKHNEDVLDAVICLYIAALYQLGVPSMLFGDTADGYIYVPQLPCV